MTLWVDADACPVRAEAETVAIRHATPVRMVSNGGIRPSAHPLVTMVYVPADPDAADIHIATHAAAGDVVVTNDLPLAARAIEAGARVLRPDGTGLTAANIGPALATRDLMADLRAADPTGGPKGGGRGFTKADRARFLQALDHLLRS